MEGYCQNYMHCLGLQVSFNNLEEAAAAVAADAVPDSPADIPDPSDELGNRIQATYTEVVEATAPGGQITDALLGFLATQTPRSTRCGRTCPLTELEDHLRPPTPD